MNRALLTSVFVFLFSLAAVSAATYDLENYPSPFIASGNINTIIVVGDSAPASHVVAQTQLALTLGQEAGQPATGRAKLASEVENLDQNIISIGSPCINSVSARIVPQNKNCYEGYEPGEASIKVYENNNYLHLVAAGYTDEATAEIARYLQKLDNHDMSGEQYTIEVEESGDVEAKRQTEEQKQETEPTPAPEPVETTQAEQTQQEEPTTHDQEDTTEQNDSGKPIIVTEPEGNVIQRFFSWLGSLFN